MGVGMEILLGIPLYIPVENAYKILQSYRMRASLTATKLNSPIVLYF